MDRGDVAAVGLAAFAVVCCAGLPVVAGVLGGLTVVSLVGIGTGIVVAAGLVAFAALLVRNRRRACGHNPRDSA